MPHQRQAAVIVVGYRNAADLAHCVESLQRASRAVPFSVFVCENGGAEAFDADVEALKIGGAIPGRIEFCDTTESTFARVATFSCGDPPFELTLAEARSNLGYAGGINAWIDRLVGNDAWKGFWVLNPDTFPAPDALEQLVLYAETNKVGMVGSRLINGRKPGRIYSRGLKWNFFAARTTGVDNQAPANLRPVPGSVEKRIDSPSGASFLITRDCAARIGPMPECYFLYFEDLEWGMKAKATAGIGYAYDAVVLHVGGTTLGSAGDRKSRSQLAVYLDFRNRLLFVRRNFPAWLPWTAMVVLARTFEFLATGSGRNFRAALGGWIAGVKNETGRPPFVA